MKKASVIIFSLMLMPNVLFSQYKAKEFTFNDGNQHDNMKISRSISNGDTIISLTNTPVIASFFVSGNVMLNKSSNSYVRVTIEDIFYNEYLVYEDYPLISDSESSFSKVGLETACMDSIRLHSLRIEAENATIILDSIYYSTYNETLNRMRSPILNRESQCKYIADRLNQRLTNNNMSWRAGLTDVALLSYEEKKALFGGIVPPLYGFDYYKQGVFVMPGSEEMLATGNLSLPTNIYPEEWDWRNRHGKNWMTPVKNQGSCGSCWAFSSISTFESYINLYYNQVVNFDLSEQEVLSCSNAGSCASGSINGAFDYIKSSGVTTENCFAYSATDEPCNHQCAVPSDRLSFAQYRHVSTMEDSIKKVLIKSPISFGNKTWYHFLTLAGYKRIQIGENVFTSSGSNYTITIMPEDPLIGQTAWLLKNSWGTSWGDNGYGYVVMPMSDAYETYKIEGEVQSSILSNSDIICEDADNDGYYFWGVGPKPTNCPICCPDTPDGDDSNPNIGKLDSYGKPIAYSFPYPTTIINTNCIWSTDKTSCGNIVITSNATLVITGQLTMNPLAKIIVQDGGTLIVNAGSIINANIEVLSSANLKLVNNGALHLDHSDNLIVSYGAEADLEYGRIITE